MPFDVSGWVEVSLGDVVEKGRNDWIGTLFLGPFRLSGDAVSERLFGLAKMTRSRAPYAERGAPQDCSRAIADEIARNAAFVRTHGEGAHGLTWALWSELEPEIDDFDSADLAESEWRPVFALVRELDSAGFLPEDIRFVVWGCW